MIPTMTAVKTSVTSTHQTMWATNGRSRNGGYMAIAAAKPNAMALNPRVDRATVRRLVARRCHAISEISSRARPAPFPAHRTPHSPRNVMTQRDTSESETACATIPTMAAPRPDCRARSAGFSDENVDASEDTPTTSSAAGSSHRNTRYASPPARRPPPRFRSASHAFHPTCTHPRRWRSCANLVSACRASSSARARACVIRSRRVDRSGSGSGGAWSIGRAYPTKHGGCSGPVASRHL